MNKAFAAAGPDEHHAITLNRGLLKLMKTIIAMPINKSLLMVQIISSLDEQRLAFPKKEFRIWKGERQTCVVRSSSCPVW